MKYKVHILGPKENGDDEGIAQEYPDVYISALIYDINALHGVSEIKRDGCHLVIQPAENCNQAILHSAVNNILKNYFVHLGPFDHEWVDRLSENRK